jgi:hypothetical protein
MNKTDNALIYLLILFVGIAAGVSTPQSWYAGGTVLPEQVTQAMLVR